MELEFAQATDRGRVREHNEDYIGCEQANGWLFALADGVGGQEMGEVASRTAVACCCASTAPPAFPHLNAVASWVVLSLTVAGAAEASHLIPEHREAAQW